MPVSRTILYLILGISFYRIWILPVSEERNKAIQLFAVQMTLNFIWSLIFFRWHLIGFALLEIMAMWIAIAMMIHKFKKLNKFAAYMNIPYLCWVSFATVLNASYYF
ncbi:MAG: TspO/MBR family protein, partial [Bacteroidota bacterium]